MIKALPPQTVVLLVEDNPADQRLAMRAMKKLGMICDVRTVLDGEAALDYLSQLNASEESPRPNLILLDLNMPKIDGIEVLRHIKQDSQLDDIPVVVLTTSNHENDQNICQALGCTAYVQKPASAEKLLHLLQNLGQSWLQLFQLTEQKI